MLTKFSVFTTSLLVAGCVASPVKSDLVGRCLSLSQVQYLWNAKGVSYSSDFFVSSRMRPQVVKDQDYLEKMDIGDRFRVESVLVDSNGSWGKFLRIQVRIVDGSYAGAVADVPVHAPYHPKEAWTKNFTLDPNALEFNEEIVVPCD